MRTLSFLTLLWILTQTVLSAEIGIAYQTWNKPLGIFQTEEQLEHDLERMHKMGIKSARVEFTWGLVEPQKGRFDFKLPVLLIQKAKKHEIKLLPIIGFQWPPAWFPKNKLLSYYDIEKKIEIKSPILNYADPEVQQLYTNFITKVVSHFKDEAIIESWILGNEYNFIDYLSHKQLGYDELTKKYFTAYLIAKYQKIEVLNRSWGQAYKSFQEIKISDYYFDSTPTAQSPAVLDFLHYRQNAIAHFVAIGSLAAKKVAPKMLRGYGAIGTQFRGQDQFNTSENNHLIAKKSRELKAPLDRFFLNSYHNLDSDHFSNLFLALLKAKADTNIETIVFSEYGLSSTDIYIQGGEENQAAYFKIQTLDNLFMGIDSMHLFTWNDKPFVDHRERGFGILDDKRNEKAIFSDLSSLIQQGRAIDWKKHSMLHHPRLKSEVTFLLPESESFEAIHFPSIGAANWTFASALAQTGIRVNFIHPLDLENKAKLQRIHTLVLNHRGLLQPSTLKKILELSKRERFHLFISGILPSSELIVSQDPDYKKLLRDEFGIENYQIISHPSSPYIYARVKEKKKNIDTMTQLFVPAPLYNASKSTTSYGTIEHGEGKNKIVVPLITIKERENQIKHITLALDPRINPSLHPTIHTKKEWKQKESTPLLKGLPELLKSIFIDELDYNTFELAHSNYQRNSYNNFILKRTINESKTDTLFYARTPAYRASLLSCHELPKESVTLSLLPAKTKYYSLLNQREYKTSWRGELTLDLIGCSTDILFRSDTFKKPKSTPSFRETINLRALRTIFPPRTLLHPNALCFKEELKREGYKEYPLKVDHSPDYKEWYVEPLKTFHVIDLKEADLLRNTFQLFVMRFKDLTSEELDNLRKILTLKNKRVVALDSVPQGLEHFIGSTLFLANNCKFSLRELP